MTPAALLLDLDGTLVDTEPMNRTAYRAFFAARGWDEPDLSLFVGRRAADVFVANPGPWTGEDPEALGREVLALMDPDAPLEPLPGAEDLLAEAVRRRIPVAIVTSAGPEWVRRAAAGPLTGLAHVDLVVTAADVVDGKPDPACYLLACERLAVEPADVMVVEDSPAGVRAAVAAGAGSVVAVTSTHQSDVLLAAGAEPVIASLAELTDLWTAPGNGVNLGG